MKHPINNFFDGEGEIKITASDQQGNELTISNSKKGYDQLSMEDMKNVIWKLKEGFNGMKDSYNGAKQYRVNNWRYIEEIRKIKEQFLERDVEKNILKKDYRFEYYFDVPPVCKYYKTFIKALKKAEKIPFSEIIDSYAETPVWRYEKTELEKELMKKFPDAYSITVKEMHNDYDLKALFKKKALKVSEAWEIQAVAFGSKIFVKERGKINMQLSLTQLEESIGNIIETLKKTNDEKIKDVARYDYYYSRIQEAKLKNLAMQHNEIFARITANGKPYTLALDVGDSVEGYKKSFPDIRLIASDKEQLCEIIYKGVKQKRI